MITHESLILAAPGLPDDASLDALLSEIAELEARCAHTYFVERYVKGRDWNELKSELSRRFGLTHRQFSSVASAVDGLAKGVREGMKERREDLKRRISAAGTRIAKWENRRKASADKDQRHREWRAKVKAAALAGRPVPALAKSLRGLSAGHEAALQSDLKRRIHHKKRYIADLQRRLTQLEADITIRRSRPPRAMPISKPIRSARLRTRCRARLDLGAPMASGRGSVPLSRPKLRCLRRGSARSRLIASGKYAAEPFDEDQARPDESQPGAGQIIAGPPVVVLVDLEERPSVPG